MIGYDFDGVLNAGVVPQGEYVIVSGRTFAEYTDDIAQYAELIPVYIRGVGEVSDTEHKADFKSIMINLLSLTTFYENDPQEAEIMREQCNECEIILIGDSTEA